MEFAKRQAVHADVNADQLPGVRVQLQRRSSAQALPQEPSHRVWTGVFPERVRPGV